MADQDFLSLDSENVLPSIDVDALDLDVESVGDLELLDPVGDAINRTVFGLDDFQSPSALRDFLATAAESANSNWAVSQMEQLAKSYRPVKHQSREPYEFRFFPITGANQEDLPNTGLLLPLPPEKFDVEKSSDPRTFISINQVEYTLPGPNQLATMSLEGMFPGTDPKKWGQTDGREGRLIQRPNYLPKYIHRGNYRTPKELASTFTNLMTKAQPVELFVGPPNGSSALVVRGGGLFTKMSVTVTSFTYGEAFGHPGSYVFSMQLKQWRRIYPKKQPPKPPQPTVVSDPVGATGGTTRPHRQPPTLKQTSQASLPDIRTYVIKSGDTLWDIAARYLGSGTRWPEIYQLNRAALVEECRRRKVSCYPKGWNIWPGTRLRLPPKNMRTGR